MVNSPNEEGEKIREATDLPITIVNFKTLYEKILVLGVTRHCI